MKYGKMLKKQIEETLPQWRDSFLSYKELKKLVNDISIGNNTSSKAEADFVSLLDDELNKLNFFFEEQEEWYIIKQMDLQERFRRIMMAKENRDEEMARIRKDIVDLHGEMVLLVNYSSVNYTGLAKILKKYDKRTGKLLRLPFIEKVLKQPFFTTDMVSTLVKQCESTMDLVFGVTSPGTFVQNGERQVNFLGEEQSILKSTIAAIVTMHELRKGSSTYGQFSLPPMSLNESEVFKSLGMQLPIIIP